MSKLSGDTARAHRIRKQRIKSRAKIRALQLALKEKKAAAAHPKT